MKDLQKKNTPAAAPAPRAVAGRAAPAPAGAAAGALEGSPPVLAQRQAIQALQQSPAMRVQRQRADALQRAAAAGGSALAARNGGVVQGAFIVAGTPVTGPALNTWIADNVPKSKPHIAAMVRTWAGDANYTTDHASDLAAYTEADSKSQDAIKSGNSTVAHQIAKGAPKSVDWGAVPVWGAWYFSGLEYQDNSTGGWHSNRQAWLPGAATTDGRPTRYVEFRRPGAIGDKESDKLERCIFDMLTGRCWPNAHYDGGYVEITGVPGAVQTRLFNIAYVATGMKARADAMTTAENAVAGAGFVKVQWLLSKLDAELT